MQKWTYKDLEFEIAPKAQGFQLTVTRDGETIYDYRVLMATHFEGLMSAAAEIYGDTIEAESIAEAGKIPYRFWDDVDCEECAGWAHYEEMLDVDGKTLCADCAAKQGEPRTFSDLIEDCPSYCQGIAELAQWSTNYDYQTGTPFLAFLDLIGYNEETHGEKLNPEKFTLDFASSDAFAQAINEWATRPADVIEYLDQLLAAEV